MESEEDRIKSKLASKKVRTLNRSSEIDEKCPLENVVLARPIRLFW
jgi:hypothetical protein